MDEVTVTQADREAAIQALNAAERQRSFGGNGTVLSQVAEIFARHRAQAERDTLGRMEWKDIESAPKDGTGILLHWPDGNSTIGCWDDQRFHKKPRPFFAGHWRGNVWERDNQPTHWMPLPPAPEAGQ